MAREARLVDDWAILSPVTNYQVLAYQLARTSLSDRLRFGRLGREYRQTFISYLRGKGAFSSRRWFSDDPDDQEPMIPNPDEVSDEMLAADSPFMQARMAWAEAQEKLAVNDDRRQLRFEKLVMYVQTDGETEELQVVDPGFYLGSQLHIPGPNGGVQNSLS